ncbi:MAG: homoserine O-succinyltransferase, partial [Acidobacteriales bacterium]|nr:homoserine O-succinyltransferase [Terriglobales bacterium]
YWQIMADVLDWAEHNTTSTVLSCLAAHAGVLHRDGIQRHPLSDKQFGVFEFHKNGDHLLTAGISSPVRFPHSRWNESRAAELTACGYRILVSSAGAGVDSFVKQQGECLFVHFQGHPEYEARTLLNEYRRDVRRFLKQERPIYPSLPRGYFDAQTTQLLNQFRQTAEPSPKEELMNSFPEAALVIPGNTWRSSAAQIYRNWLQHLLSGKTRRSVCAGNIQPSHAAQ